MKYTDQLISSLDERIPGYSVLAFKFLATFSRFEFALKNASFMIKNNPDAIPDWDTFADSILGTFNPDVTPEIRAAVDYIIGNPPRKQENVHNVPTYVDAVNGSALTKQLVVYIRRIRNNLMHGGKFNNFEPESRNEKLITSSLLILNNWLDLNNDVNGYFISNIEP